MKNNINYYQHFINSSDHPKFKMLRVKYGWAGEGKFWALNNKIGEAENCEIDLSKKYNKASIANDLNFTLEEFDEFLEYLAEECNLIIKKNNCITTETIRENLLKVMKERKRNKKSYENRKIKDVNKSSTKFQPVEIKIQPVEKIQSKVKESKEKESIKEKDILSFCSGRISFSIKEYSHLVNEEFKDIWEAWIEVRKEKKTPNTQRATKIALNKLHKHPVEIAIKMLEKAVESGWKGIYPLEDRETKQNKKEVCEND